MSRRRTSVAKVTERAKGQAAAAEQLEEWLKHYRTELQHKADPAADKSTPAAATPGERLP